MPKPVANPPNPFKSTWVEWIDAPPMADLEVYEEHAKTVLSSNDSPDVGFTWSLNPYRGCFHACAYCLWEETPVRMADGTQRPIRDLRVGDRIVGTRHAAGGRRLTTTQVLAHWESRKPALHVRLANGTELIASADHRFLTPSGWKHLSSVEAEDAFVEIVATRTQTRMGDLAMFRQEFDLPDRSTERRVLSVEPLGVEMPMYDITTGTGDFIANGVVSHNCYARPSHQYWDFDAGTDFERKIVVKVNAPEVLREHFMKKSWKGELIAFSGNTDCYQPLEASYELTRKCLQVCAEFRNPVGLITKGAIIRRDIDVLQELHRNARVHVNMSIAFADDDMARKIEPYAPAPSTRLKAMEALAKAGIPVGVGVAPIIPGLNDSQLAEILTRARDAGATRAFRVMLRLPAEVKPVFLGRLQEAYPDRAKKVVGGIRDVRGGALYRSEFGVRGKGQGPRWDAVEALFDLTCKRLGLNAEDEEPREVHEYRGGPREVDAVEKEDETTFRRPGDQLSLFGK